MKTIKALIVLGWSLVTLVNIVLIAVTCGLSIVLGPVLWYLAVCQMSQGIGQWLVFIIGTMFTINTVNLMWRD